jgi:hypothetical protein
MKQASIGVLADYYQAGVCEASFLQAKQLDCMAYLFELRNEGNWRKSV